MTKKLSFYLPYPIKCSVNAMYIWNKKGSILLSCHAKKYKQDVYYLTRQLEKFGSDDVSVDISMYPPDNRTRDTDNILKVLFDSLQYSQIIDNDKQIKKHTVEKMQIVKNGRLEITIKSIV
jgi:crossover junction endodeoxyribonuclease RusA